MKIAASLLALALMPNAVAEPEALHDTEAECKAEGGCILITQAALQEALAQAYQAGIQVTRRSCRNYL